MSDYHITPVDYPPTGRLKVEATGDPWNPYVVTDETGRILAHFIERSHAKQAIYNYYNNPQWHDGHA